MQETYVFRIDELQQLYRTLMSTQNLNMKDLSQINGFGLPTAGAVQRHWALPHS
jgi:hypothetical protein